MLDKYQYLYLRPLMALLSEKAERIRCREVKRAMSKLPDLSKAEMRAVEHMSRMIVRKLLREPMMKVNAAAGTAQEQFYTKNTSRSRLSEFFRTLCSAPRSSPKQKTERMNCTAE